MEFENDKCTDFSEQLTAIKHYTSDYSPNMSSCSNPTSTFSKYINFLCKIDANGTSSEMTSSRAKKWRH